MSAGEPPPAVLDIPCTEPADELPVRHRPCVYGVAFDAAGRVCVAREAAGEYYLPGGGIEEGEDAGAALVREVAEELARVGVAGALFATGSEWLGGPEAGEWLHKRAAFHHLTLGAALPDATAEHTLVWLTPAEAGARLQYACHRQAVAQAQCILNSFTPEP